MPPRDDPERLNLDRDGRDWPNRAFSQLVDSGGLRWHIQRLGAGPKLLLVHGTGASTHSWRDVAPLLANRFEILAPDLPGHGFTGEGPSGSLSLPGMSQALAALLRTLAFEPAVAVGHSAGAAILARLCIDKIIAPKLLVSFNGAFLPFGGLAGQFFPPVAKLLFLNPFTPRLFAWSADESAVSRLLRGTGSPLDRQGVELYRRLFHNHRHVEGALGMMANWNLAPLLRDLPRLTNHTALIVASGDKAIAPGNARQVAALLPDAEVIALPGVGHLAHEERPQEAAERIIALSAAAGVIR